MVACRLGYHRAGTHGPPATGEIRGKTPPMSPATYIRIGGLSLVRGRETNTMVHSTRGGNMGATDGTSDESIGRPREWREGRYQEADKPVKETVVTPPGTAPASRNPVSTPVTRKDYEQKQSPPPLHSRGCQK
jgi:hypothetical protein